MDQYKLQAVFPPAVLALLDVVISLTTGYLPYQLPLLIAASFMLFLCAHILWSKKPSVASKRALRNLMMIYVVGITLVLLDWRLSSQRLDPIVYRFPFWVIIYIFCLWRAHQLQSE